jgi:glycosyltransferase involved in cell wall biosynthesis
MTATRAIARRTPRVLMVGPGPGSKGGMASVIASYTRMSFWSGYDCLWIPTVDGRPGFGKVAAFLGALRLTLQSISAAEIVHVHLAPHRSFYRKSIFIALARLFGRPVIAHVHAGDFAAFWNGGAWRRNFVSAVMRRARLVLAVSGALRDDLRRCCPDLPVLVVPNPYDPPAAAPPKRNALTVLFAGRIAREKGVFDLIAAFAEVRRILPGARLVIAGEGRLAEAVALARELGLADAIEFPGWVTGGALAQCYAEAAAFCLPSYVEGMPVCVLEAMAAGAPVVATSIGGMRDLPVDAAVLVEPGDVGSLSRELVRVLESELLQRQLAAAGRRALAAHAVERVNQHLESIYEELLTERCARPALRPV